jgi:hypothetical protein
MRRTQWILPLGLVLALGIGPESRAGRASGAATTVDSPQPATRSSGADSLRGLPLRFEPNRGQMDERVRFLARGQGYGLYLTTEGATLALYRSVPGSHPAKPGVHGRHDEAQREQAVVSMHLVGGRRDVEPVGSEVQPGQSHYFVGNDPARWRTDIEGYGRVQYSGMLPGVDVVYYGSGQRRLEYDLVLAPGVDAKSVEVAFDGAESVTIDGEGAAVLELPAGGEIVQPAPVAYQVGADGTRHRVDVRYEGRGAALGFSVGPYDRERPLVVDPTLAYSTFLGGAAADQANGIAIDSADEIYVTGYTQSSNFPTAVPLQPNLVGLTEFFVTKLSADGSTLIYSTYVGGSAQDIAQGIAVDGAGEAFVTGFTGSSDFPTTAFPIQARFAGSEDAFVTKLSAAGDHLVYSTYLGGRSLDQANSIALDSAGEAFVTGITASTNFPIASPFQAANAFGDDVFVAKLSADGTALVYSTYLGGNAADQGYSIAVDGAGDAFVAGYTTSTNFPTASPFQAANAGGYDGFVTELNPAGSALTYSTYLGGSSDDVAQAIALDSAGEAFVTGYTPSADFPTASPLLPHAGANDAFVVKFSAAGSPLLYSTYLGGSADDIAQSIAVDSAGEAFVAGYTASTNFPTASPVQSANAGANDAFITRINSAGSALVYSTYLGGSSSDSAQSIVLDRFAEAFVAGGTESPDFPTVAPIQAANGGGVSDAFVARIYVVPLVGLPAFGGRQALLLATVLLMLGILRARSTRGRSPA